MVISEKSVNGTLVKSALNGAWVYTKNYLSGERHVCFSNGNQPNWFRFFARRAMRICRQSKENVFMSQLKTALNFTMRISCQIHNTVNTPRQLQKFYLILRLSFGAFMFPPLAQKKFDGFLTKSCRIVTRLKISLPNLKAILKRVFGSRGLTSYYLITKVFRGDVVNGFKRGTKVSSALKSRFKCDFCYRFL